MLTNMIDYYTKVCNLGSCFVFAFSNCYLAATWPTFGPSQMDSLTKPMLITAFELFQPEGYWEPLNKVGSLSHAKHQGVFEPETIWF